jgi:hypothetical protein
MEKFKAPLSIKIIFILNEVVFWLFNLACVAALVLATLVLAGVLDEMQLHVSLPVAFNTEEVGYITVNGQVSNVQLVEGYADIHFIDTPLHISRPFMFPVLLVCGILYFMLFTFRKFIRNVRRGTIFEMNNIKLLRVLSFGLLGFWFFWKLYDWIVGNLIGDRLRFGTIEITEQTQNHNAILIFSIVLWALSHIFIQGMKLKDENKLTI